MRPDWCSSATSKLGPISDRPSRQDAERALALLCGLLVEFPFANEASHAVALSMLMTPVLVPP